MSCDGLFQNPTELSSGVPAYTVVMLQNVLTGETTIQTDGSTDVVATVEAPSGYQPVTNSWNGWMWNWYEQVVAQPDVWGLSPGEIPPPIITLKAMLVDVSNYATYAAYQSNMEAEAEAAQAASASSVGIGFMAMDEDEDVPGGDPCSITNLTQPFYVTIITQSVNRATTITWQSCQIFRYLVWEANSLSTNTQWFPTAYVWGATNLSYTSWTDTATTNDDGSTVTQRFYRIQRILGSVIAAGGYHGLAVLTTNNLWVWGGDDQGQLGDGKTASEYYPTIPDLCSGISNLVSVAAGYDYSVAVDDNGVLWTWGQDAYGQLANGNDNASNVSPSPISGMSNFVSVAAGERHTLALLTNGTVWASGLDSNGYLAAYGQLGVGGLPYPFYTNSLIQSSIPNGTMIVAIAAGGYHSLALDNSGNVWSWGWGASGQLGNGGTTNLTTPTKLSTISNVIAIAGGYYHSMALTADKNLWTWGDNFSGELGRGGSNQFPGRVLASGLSSNVVAISAGDGFSLAVTTNGYVYTWGDNTFGELGNGSQGGSLTTPTSIAGISNVVQVAASPTGPHGMSLALDHGTNYVWGWGYDNNGEVGTTNGEAYAGFWYVDTPQMLQFCSCVQLGTSNVFTAPCTGTLVLFFNDDDFGDDTDGFYTVSITGITNNATVLSGDSAGVAVGTVSNGVSYTCTASGFCDRGDDHLTDPDGDNVEGFLVGCNGGGGHTCQTPCPGSICYSLVGKIVPQ